MTLDLLASLLATSVVAAPLAAFALLGLVRLVGRSTMERWSSRLVAAGFGLGVVGTVATALLLYVDGRDALVVHLGTWFSAGDYAFRVTLLLDRLSLPFMFLATVLCGTIAAFSARYLHREAGHRRFMTLLCLFGAGVLLVTSAGSFDVAYAGWELVGLTSALLVAFFHEREAPLVHGLWTFAVYRVCDVGLLLTAILIHSWASTAEYGELLLGGAWPGGSTSLGATKATAVCLLLLFAAVGKSAQVPLSGWLPRAMEGPTPSSAIFYGALSVHLGAYVLLRAGPLLDQSPLASSLLVAVGLATALHATLVGRVQTDVKCALAYASMTQVAIIFVEIGLGFRFLALVHLMAHAALRTLQFLRAPSFLHEHHQLEAAMGHHLARTGRHFERLLPERSQRWLYRLALERGYHDTLLEVWCVRPVLGVLRWLDRREHALVRWLGGRA